MSLLEIKYAITVTAIMNKIRKDNEPPLATSEWGWRYHHLGIPTSEQIEGEIYLPKLKLYVSGFDKSPFGVEWMRFETESPFNDLIKKVPHIAFEVDDLDSGTQQEEVQYYNSNQILPGEGIRVAMIEHNGVPVELIEFNKKTSKSG